MTKIHLIGTMHYGLKDAKRLERALLVEKPQILTFEASPQWLDYLAKHWDEDLEMCLQAIRKKGFSKKAYSLIEEYLRSISNFGYDLCKDYSNQTNIPLYLIDDPSMVDLLRQETLSQFQTFFDNINPQILDEISLESVIEGQDKMYTQIQNLYDGKIPAILGEQLIDPQRGKLIGKRDKTEAKNIRELAQNNNAKIVHVGGYIHNLTDSRDETLYSRLGKLNPSRTTLLSYDR